MIGNGLIGSYAIGGTAETGPSIPDGWVPVQFVARTSTGTIAEGVEFRVYIGGTEDLADLLDDEGQALAQPVLSNELGVVRFHALQCAYDIQAIAAGQETWWRGFRVVDAECLVDPDPTKLDESFRPGQVLLLPAAGDLRDTVPADGSFFDADQYPDLSDAYPGDLFENFEAVTDFTDPPAATQGCAFSRNGKWLAVGSWTGDVAQVFSVSDWSKIADLGLETDFADRDVAFNADSSLVAVASDEGGYLRIYKTDTWSEVSGVPSLPGIGRRVRFSPDGDYLAVAHDGGNRFSVFRVSDWSQVSGTPAFSSNVQGISWSGDGSRFVVAVFEFSANGMWVFSTDTWSEISTGLPDIKSATGVDWNPRKNLIAVSTTDSERDGFLLIDATQWFVLSGTPALRAGGVDVAFSACGEMLSISDDDAGPAIYWTVMLLKDYSFAGDLPALDGTVRRMAWQADAPYLAATHSGGDEITVVEAPQVANRLPFIAAPDPSLTYRVYSKEGS